MFLLFLNGRKYLSTSKGSWEETAKREKLKTQKREGSIDDPRSQRQQEEMGFNPEHNERVLHSVTRKRSQGHHKQKEQHEKREGHGSAKTGH